ncbi:MULTISPECIES: hypothetical protein [unclassified Acinetobacter]|uniref:hypothetical protein n=1 Tax=unclassified Acinetobacter TaxID=196816 RepID=UPI00190A5E41|nr:MULTISPECIES: hypothetical protein [unclassified Acinetobacter]MBK0062223.1 hypothetical protein [Acinetobacter sp. S55]MBK0066027.1 hypothetical protein [Acinetobacter sp. S54]
MLISRQNFLKLGNEFKLERIYNIVVAVIIITMLILAFMALQRPISKPQHQSIVNLSHMANNPETQKIAQQLLQHDGISRAEYFKLMRAYQYENSKAQHYPAMALEDE